MELVVGIDVSKDHLDVEPGDSPYFRVANDEVGVEQMVERLKPLQPTLVVLEASGGYERRALWSLWAAGIPLARINPRDAHHFAQARRQFAKSDRLDAHGLRLFGEQLKPSPTPPANPADQELQELVRRRQQLVAMITAEKNRQQQASNPAIRASIGRTIKALHKEKDAIEGELERKLEQQPSRRVAVLESVPGVGVVTTATLLASMPELGTLNARQAGALVGSAPFVRTSGKWRGESHIRGGRADVRCALYMAAHNAVRCQGPLREFYLRLRARGKQRQVALTACMRKLIVILNALLKHDTLWSPLCANPG